MPPKSSGQAHRASSEFDLVDTDKSGTISRAEYEAAYGKARAEAEFDRADTNKDGELSRQEYVAAYDAIKVVLRVRPPPKEEHHDSFIDIPEGGRQITVAPKSDSVASPQSFQFDRVFSPNSSQRSIYDEVGAPLVENVLEGFNGCVFAYGQTGWLACGHGYI